MKQLFLSLFFLFQAGISVACLNTYQFKMFPVGITKNNIISIDVQIRRTSQSEGNQWLKLGLTNIKEVSEMWILCSFIATYDHNQNLLSLRPYDTTYSLGKKYSDSLNNAFQRGLTLIELNFSSFEYFKPQSLSFCDFQLRCSLVALELDSISDKNYILHAGKKYDVSLFKDTGYYGFNARQYKNITELYINSVRVYSTSTITLIISHIGTGHEILMGFEPYSMNRTEETKETELAPIREYKADFEFSDIKKSTYVEPLLHHGFGADLFFVK